MRNTTKFVLLTSLCVGSMLMGFFVGSLKKASLYTANVLVDGLSSTDSAVYETWAGDHIIRLDNIYYFRPMGSSSVFLADSDTFYEVAGSILSFHKPRLTQGEVSPFDDWHPAVEYRSGSFSFLDLSDRRISYRMNRRED